VEQVLQAGTTDDLGVIAGVGSEGVGLVVWDRVDMIMENEETV
jgi:hypothetical protein